MLVNPMYVAQYIKFKSNVFNVTVFVCVTLFVSVITCYADF